MRGSRWPAPSRAGGTVAAVLVAVALISCAKGAPGPVAAPGVEPPVFAAASPTWWPPRPPSDRWYPVAVLALPGDKLAVAETGQNRLFLLAPDGDPKRLPAPGRRVVEWTALAAGPGLFFYALDGPGRAVHQYDYEGNYLGLALDLDRVARDEGLGDVEPAGLAVDRSGQAVITDRMGDRLLVFGPAWRFTGEWGQSGSGPGAWRGPNRVAVGARPPYIVADEGNRRVVLVDRFGVTVAVRPLSDPPRGVAALGEDRYAVALRDRVEILDGALGLVRVYALPRGEGCDRVPYATPALAGDGQVLFAGEGCSGRVVALRPRRD